MSLNGTTTPEGILLKCLLLSNAECAVYEAEDSTVLLVVPQEAAQNVVNRFLEASYFNNIHLARVRSAGVLEPHGLVYAVTEPVEHTLAHYISKRPLPEDDTKDMTEQIVDGLAYLHSENLTFCNLRPEAVWRSGSTWKLGDFSQLRVIGHGDSRELRSTLARKLDSPPEAYQGEVLPAWDVWSLGALLRRVLTPEDLHVMGSIATPRGRQLRNGDLPAPFDGITRDCLEPDPNSRITLDQVRVRLHDKQPRQSRLRSAPLATASRERVAGLLARFQSLTTAAKIGLAVFVAALVLGIITSEAKLLGRGAKQSLPEPVPITVSEADRLKAPEPAEVVSQALTATSRAARITAARAIENVLDKYIASTKARDINANLDLYAPFVENFYLRQGLTRDQLLAEKKRQFRSIGTVYRYSLDKIMVVWPSPDTALVSFDKNWSFGDRNPFSGAERAQLRLRNIQGSWKIVGERELKVYWTRHGGA